MRKDKINSKGKEVMKIIDMQIKRKFQLVKKMKDMRQVSFIGILHQMSIQ